MTWNDRFAAEDYLFGEDPAAFLVRNRAHLRAGDHVLAVADGEGRNSVWLARQGLTVTAFDYAENGLRKARALADRRGVTVEFLLADAMQFPWDARSYDVVAAVFIQFAGPKDRAAIFAGMDAALKPGGLLLLHGFAPRQVANGTGGPPHEENMYTLDLLRGAFAGYDILDAADFDDHLATGTGHRGKVALIDFVARKPGG